MARYCVDPVCKSKVEEEKAAHSSEHKGKKVYFCSPKFSDLLSLPGKRFVP